MTKAERIQAIERYVDFIQKDAIKFANDKETLEEDKTHYATAIEEYVSDEIKKGTNIISLYGYPLGEIKQMIDFCRERDFKPKQSQPTKRL